jgi:hypothetical protein
VRALARVLATAFLACAFLIASPAGAQALYKWTDASGKVFYSDRPPPKEFKGAVERIEREPPLAPPVTPSAPVIPPIVVQGEKPAPVPSPDIAKQRRATRERLQAQVDAARVRVEAAKKALDEGRDPQVEDRRVIQQTIDGTTPASITLRNNCKSGNDPNGKAVTVCPTTVLNDEYFARLEKLEEALKQAEDDLDVAQNAYRRGVD